MFLALSAWIQMFSSVSFCVFIQTEFSCKLFVTHCTHMRPWLVIMWMLSDIITISFSLYFKGCFTCIIYTTWDIIQCCHITKQQLKFVIMMMRSIDNEQQQENYANMTNKCREYRIRKPNIPVLGLSSCGHSVMSWTSTELPPVYAQYES